MKQPKQNGLGSERRLGGNRARSVPSELPDWHRDREGVGRDPKQDFETFTWTKEPNKDLKAPQTTRPRCTWTTRIHQLDQSSWRAHWPRSKHTDRYNHPTQTFLVESTHHIMRHPNRSPCLTYNHLIRRTPPSKQDYGSMRSRSDECRGSWIKVFTGRTTTKVRIRKRED